MTNERTCPHCGGAVPLDRIICPHCNRTMPTAEPSAPPAQPTHAPPAPTPDDTQPSGVLPAVAQVPAVPPPPQAPGGQYQPPSAYPPPPGAPPSGQQPPPQYQPPAAPPPGYPQPEPPRITPPTPHHDDSMAIVGLILSILGIACCTCLSILCPIGLILSVVAHNRRQTGVTLAGIIIGILGTLLFVGYAVLQIYLAMHPELQQEMLQRIFEQMGIPVPPGGFPSPW